MSALGHKRNPGCSPKQVRFTAQSRHTQEVSLPHVGVPLLPAAASRHSAVTVAHWPQTERRRRATIARAETHVLAAGTGGGHAPLSSGALGSERAATRGASAPRRAQACVCSIAPPASIAQVRPAAPRSSSPPRSPPHSSAAADRADPGGGRRRLRPAAPAGADHRQLCHRCHRLQQRRYPHQQRRRRCDQPHDHRLQPLYRPLQ